MASLCDTTGVLHRNCFSFDSTRCQPEVGPTLEFRSRALARATSCFCPADRGAPPSASAISRPMGLDSTTLARCARLNAAQMSISLCRSKGSKLLRMVPVNSTGTCKPPEASTSSPCPPRHLSNVQPTMFTTAIVPARSLELVALTLRATVLGKGQLYCGQHYFIVLDMHFR